MDGRDVGIDVGSILDVGAEKESGVVFGIEKESIPPNSVCQIRDSCVRGSSTGKPRHSVQSKQPAKKQQ